MRLIDADALFDWGKYKLSDAVKYGNKDSDQQSFSYGKMMMYEIADEIDDAPTIDAVPVVRCPDGGCKNEGNGCHECTRNPRYFDNCDMVSMDAQTGI